MRWIALVIILAAAPAQARELFGEDARTIVRDGDVLASGVGDPPPWVDPADHSSHLYLLVAYDGSVYFCNAGASNFGASTELRCRRDAR